MSKAIKPTKSITPAEDEAAINDAMAHIRRRTRPQPKNDNLPDDNISPAARAQDAPPSSTNNTNEQDATSPRSRQSDKTAHRKTPRRRTGDYEIGYGKPPVHSRFQPGQCPNPKGRPKNAKGVKTHMEEVYFQPTTVRRDGKTRKVPLFRALLEVQAQKAAAGDLKALNAVMQDVVTYFGSELLQGPSPQSTGHDEIGLTDSDRAMLAFHERERMLRLGFSEEAADNVLRDMGLIDTAGTKAPDGDRDDPDDPDDRDDADDDDLDGVI